MQMKKPKYDIFISYRRTAYDTANLIAVKLRHAGYKVFFDVDTLTTGKFNEQLLEVIKGCKDFILVLPENAFDRCDDTEDWVRRETMCALENHKNILPVMLDGFSWPKEMSQGLEKLSSYQAIAAVWKRKITPQRLGNSFLQDSSWARTYMKWANDAFSKAQLRMKWAEDAREKAELRLKWAREASRRKGNLAHHVTFGA